MVLDEDWSASQPKSAAVRAMLVIFAEVVGLISNVVTFSASRGRLHKKKRNHWTWFCCKYVASNVDPAFTLKIMRFWPITFGATRTFTAR